MRRLLPARFSLSIISLSLAAAAAVRVSPSAASEALRYDLRAEIGGEYDDNAHRAEIIQGAENQPRVVASPLARAALGGRLSDVVARGQQITGSATRAGKLFTAPDARTEDVAIADSSARWRLRLGERTGGALQAVYYEAFQRAGNDELSQAERR